MNADPIIPLCSHVKTNGRTCGSPALKGNTLCYFHNKIRVTHRRPESHIHIPLTSDAQEYCILDDSGGHEYQDDPHAVARAYPHQNEIEFPPLEDAESVQLATSMLFQAIATGQIHFRRARLLLYTLKIASINQRALIQSRAADAAADTASHIEHPGNPRLQPWASSAPEGEGASAPGAASNQAASLAPPVLAPSNLEPRTSDLSFPPANPNPLYSLPATPANPVAYA